MAAAVLVPLVIALKAELPPLGQDAVVAPPLASVQRGALVPLTVPAKSTLVSPVPWTLDAII
jgi:hypothetical protein